MLAACQNPATPGPGTAPEPVPGNAEPPPTTIPELPAAAAEPAATFTPALEPSRTPAAETRLDVLVRVLHVQVPRAARSRMAALWDQLHEDAGDSQMRQRLSSNGVRVGLGRTEYWPGVEDVLGAIEGLRRYELPPLRTPPGVPLALELDAQPAEQTIFFVGGDGVLTGETWPDSQRVLRVTYTLDARDRERVFLSIVPEIRRHDPAGLAYTADGWQTGAQRAGRTFPAAALVVPLGAAEFVLLAPGEKADLFGLVGGAFLTGQQDSQAYDSYVFFRTDMRHVAQRQ